MKHERTASKINRFYKIYIYLYRFISLIASGTHQLSFQNHFQFLRLLILAKLPFPFPQVFAVSYTEKNDGNCIMMQEYYAKLLTVIISVLY